MLYKCKQAGGTFHKGFYMKLYSPPPNKKKLLAMISLKMEFNISDKKKKKNQNVLFSKIFLPTSFVSEEKKWKEGNDVRPTRFTLDE